MGGIALLARELGVQVSGSDANVYPPMSTQLREQGIGLHEGYDSGALEPAPDCVADELRNRRLHRRRWFESVSKVVPNIARPPGKSTDRNSTESC